MGLNLSLEGKVAFVTGASRGIGRAIALALAEAGADVAIADLHLEPFAGERYFRMKKRVSGSEEETRTAEAVGELGCRAIELELDVSDPDAASRAVEECERQLGSLDIVVNNAGIVNNIAPIASMSPTPGSTSSASTSAAHFTAFARPRQAWPNAVGGV